MVRLHRPLRGHPHGTYAGLLGLLMLAALPLLAAGAYGAPAAQTLQHVSYLPLVQVESNFVAYWPFDAGSTRDISGNNDGVGSGIAPTSDRFAHPNDAFQFDTWAERPFVLEDHTLNVGPLGLHPKGGA